MYECHIHVERRLGYVKGIYIAAVGAAQKCAAGSNSPMPKKIAPLRVSEEGRRML
jgi:hypothetical protein